jgi:hypothetical protein
MERWLQQVRRLSSATEISMSRVNALPEGVSGPPAFTDGFGARYLGFDGESADPIEVLAFAPSLIAATEFASAVGVRVARVSGARHTLFARVRRIERPTPDSLLLISDRVAGWRLADVLDIASRIGLRLDTSAVLNLLRQLVPAVALFGRHQRDLVIGNIGPERLILTPNGRLVLAEYVLGDAIGKLAMSRADLWRSYRVAAADGSGEPSRADVVAIGVVALSLLLGRRLREDEFPFAIGDLLQQVTETHGSNSRPLSPALASWLARALQLDGHKPLRSPKEAQVAFEEMLATERGYVTSPALLESFIDQYQERAGSPPEPERPVAQVQQAPPPVAQRAPVAVVEPPPPEKRAEPEPAAPAAASVSPGWEGSSALRGTGPTPPVAPVAAEPHVLEVARQEPPVAEPSSVVSVDSGLGAPREGGGSATASVEPATTVASAAGREEPRAWLTKLVAGLALLVVLEAAAIFWLWNRSAAALLRDGELTVQTLPPAARVTVDDEEIGESPVTVRLAPGTYTLKVQHGGSEPRVIVVEIRPGVQTAQYLELQAGR